MLRSCFVKNPSTQTARVESSRVEYNIPVCYVFVSQRNHVQLSSCKKRIESSKPQEVDSIQLVLTAASKKTKPAINVNLTTPENVSGKKKKKNNRIKANEKLQLINGKRFGAETEMRNKKYLKNYILKYSLFPAFVILFRCKFLAMHARRNLPFTKGKKFAAPVEYCRTLYWITPLSMAPKTLCFYITTFNIPTVVDV